MRLVLSAFAVVGGFAIGAFVIARSMPDAPVWVKVMLAMLWLMTLIAGVFITGNSIAIKTKLSAHHIRDALVYMAAASIIAAVCSAVFVHDVVNGIRINFKENWIITVSAAAVVCVYVVKMFWSVRHSLRLWSVLALYLIVHFSVGIPAMGAMQSVPLIYIWPIAMIELMVLMFLLEKITVDVQPLQERREDLPTK